MAFANVAANLRLNISDFSSKLATASKQMSNFARTMNKQYGDASRSLTKHNFGLKDTARIVQGILVAQTFYAGARAIREATSALWDFNKSLDYAQVTYSALFGDTKLASNFMSVLKEHSIETIFDYQDLADASKKLLAYGIEYKNLMFVMEGLTNLGAMSGDTAALDRISLALGQIYTRGKLTAEEMRQLANAYVPIANIIQEKFNLTPDQMGKVGNLNLPAGEVINAVVDYANERFASVGDAAMYTITGLQNKIVDTLKVVGVEMIAPITTAYKSFLVYIANGLEALREEFAAGGLGGVFEFLVPDKNTQQVIRQFIANVSNLFKSLVSVGVVAGQVFGNFVSVLVTAFNIVGPVITGFINVISAALHAMLSTRTGATILRVALLGAAAAFVVLRVQALSALVITTVTKAVMGLSRALLVLATLVTRHPILMLLSGLAIALVGVSTASGNANSGLNKLFDTLSGANGKSSGDVLQRTEQEATDAADALNDYNERFDEGADAANNLAKGIDGIGKSADKAKKKAGLLSFDEVYKLNEPTDSASGSGSGAGSVLDDIEGLMAGLDSLSDAIIPDIPDFSTFFDEFTDSLFGGLQDSLITKLAAIGLGARFASKLAEALRRTPLTGVVSVARNIGVAILRAVSGALVGLGVDAIASQFTQKLWQSLEEALGIAEGSAEQAKLGATIGSVIGGAIGMLVGGLPGSLIGSAIGHLAGGIVGLLWQEIGGALSNSIAGLGTGIASAISKAVGIGFGELVRAIDFSTLSSAFKGIGLTFKTVGLKAIAKGGAIGLAIGFITDGIAALLWNTLADKFNLSEGAEGTAKIGQTIGSVVGTVIGGVLGGPAGAMLGSVIGTFAGGLVGLFWDKIVDYFANPDVQLGTIIGASLGMFFGPIGAAVGAVIGGVVGKFWDDISPALNGWLENMSKRFSGWLQDMSDACDDFGEWLIGIGESVMAGWDQLWTDLGALVAEIGLGLLNWWEDLKLNWATKWDEIYTGFTTWWDNTKTGWSTKYEEIKTNLGNWWDNVKTTYNTKKDAISASLSTWWNTTKTNWSTKYGEIKNSVSTWWDEVKSSYSTKQSEIMNSLSSWWGDTKTNWSTKYDEIKTNLSTWWSGVQRDLGVNFGTMLSTVGTKLTEVKDKWSEKWDAVQEKFGKWWKDLKADMDNWLEDYVWKPISNFFNINNFWNRIKGLLDAIKKKVSSWWSSLTSIFGDGGSVSVNVTGSGSGGANLAGHARGGIFNREHIARFAEGNKAEMAVPLENASAMQPFVNAISDGILQGLMPAMASSGGQSNLPPMYVGTLIADDRGIKQLYKKFEIIEAQEAARKGFA